jgi:SPP1 family predicted phage head-tail adaptor
MARKFLPSLFNKKIQLGTIKSVENDNTGDYSEQFVSQLSLWAYPQKRAISQTYKLLNTDFEDSIVLVVRHNSKINDQLKVIYNGQQYDIINLSSDDSLNYMAYDYLTVKLSEKVK